MDKERINRFDQIMNLRPPETEVHKRVIESERGKIIEEMEIALLGLSGREHISRDAYKGFKRQFFGAWFWAIEVGLPPLELLNEAHQLLDNQGEDWVELQKGLKPKHKK